MMGDMFEDLIKEHPFEVDKKVEPQEHKGSFKTSVTGKSATMVCDDCKKPLYAIDGAHNQARCHSCQRVYYIKNFVNNTSIGYHAQGEAAYSSLARSVTLTRDDILLDNHNADTAKKIGTALCDALTDDIVTVLLNK